MQDQELLNFHYSPNNVNVNKSEIMKRKGHIARMEDVRNSDRISVVNVKRRTQLGDLEVDERMLKWISNITQNCGGMVYSDSEQGPVTGSCEHDNGSSGSI
jgi:hypothetical protein